MRSLAMKNDQCLSVSDAAKQLHCTTKYVYDMLQSGSLSATKTDGRWKISASDVAAKLAKRSGK
jgi:excisionase family DNA binding protein